MEQSQMDQLKNRDYTIVLDKSGSMSGDDTPTRQSRWDYAKESVSAIAHKLNEYDPDGITLIPFGSSFKRYDNATPAKLQDIYAEHSPMGSTVLAPVLQNVFENFLANKKAGKLKSNGEICLVITDGQPSDQELVANTIVNFTKQLDNGDGEFGICFMQIGHDKDATKFLNFLDDELVSKRGAKFDIVDTKTIDQVEQLGLTETLIAALTD